MSEQEEILRIQRAIIEVLQEFKARGVDKVKKDVLRREVERRLHVKFED